MSDKGKTSTIELGENQSYTNRQFKYREMNEANMERSLEFTELEIQITKVL